MIEAYLCVYFRALLDCCLLLLATLPAQNQQVPSARRSSRSARSRDSSTIRLATLSPVRAVGQGDGSVGYLHPDGYAAGDEGEDWRATRRTWTSSMRSCFTRPASCRSMTSRRRPLAVVREGRREGFYWRFTRDGYALSMAGIWRDARRLVRPASVGDVRGSDHCGGQELSCHEAHAEVVRHEGRDLSV